MDRNGDTQCYSERFETSAEAAVLFAAGFRHPALQMLRRECEHLGTAAGPKAWTMLFEACHLLGERDEFDRLAVRYRESFAGASAPRWGYAAAVEAPGTARLAGTLASMEDVRDLVEAAKSRKAVAIDFSRVERIDFTFAPTLCALFRTYGMQGKRLILAHIAELHAELLHSVGIGPHVALLRRRLLDHDANVAPVASNDERAEAAALAAA
jgi:anti-anti-sigma regulatory factor